MVSGSERPTPPSGRITVVVTVLGDPRVERTLESLLDQRRRPDEILVADGGGSDVVRAICEKLSARDPRVRHLFAPGNIPESRNLAIANSTGDWIAFLDADEVAPPDWLDHLVRPMADRSVGFVGGPTPALAGTARSIGARYYDGYLRRFYDRIARRRPHALPMGNSAWRAELFRRVGPLDTSLYRRAASEDQDIAVRALASGYHGLYVPEAFVWHDFSGLTTYRLLRKQRTYAEGGFVVWRRRGTTYEATPTRLLPYVALPVVGVAGLLLLPFAATRGVGELLGIVAGFGLVVLALVLTGLGLREESRYPGLKFQAIEILRRWATIYGAFRGLVEFGARGDSARRGVPR